MNTDQDILIVDDEPVNLRLLEALLQSDGYSVHMAANGDEAIRRVHEVRPDLILLDVMMPGQDGFQVCRRLRSEEPFRLVPIVMVTALNSMEDKVNGLAAGADDFLSKPVHRDELRAKIQSLLRVRSLELELERSRAELAERNRKLQELACYKEQLTQMLVHDMRSPLTGIIGNLDLVQMLMGRNGDRDKCELLVRRAQDSSRQLEDLVTDILDIGRLQDRQMELEIADVDLRGLFIECFRTVESFADLEEKRLVLEVAEGLPPVPADRGLLRRILGNLLQNALKFTPVGGEIRLAADIREPWVRIRVSDTGEGIPENLREWIFERFRRAPRPGETPRPGYGLGLAFCRLAAEAHSGRIRVESNPSGGSVFVLELPAAAGARQSGQGSPPVPDRDRKGAAG